MSLKKLIAETTEQKEKVIVFENGNKMGIGFIRNGIFHDMNLPEGIIPQESINISCQNPPIPSFIAGSFEGNYYILEVSKSTFNEIFVKPFQKMA